MASENTTPSASNNDDDNHLQDLLNEIAGESPELQDEFKQQDYAEFDEQAEAASREVMAHLLSELPVVVQLAEIQLSLSQGDDRATLDEVERALGHTIKAIKNRGDSAEMEEPVHRMINALEAVRSIALGSLEPAGNPLMKKEVQSRIMTDNALTPEEKQAFLGASDEFIEGDSIDPDDLDSSMEVFSEKQAEDELNEIHRQLRVKLQPLFDEFVANYNSVDINDEAYKSLKSLAITEIIGNIPGVFQQQINGYLEQLDIDLGEYYNAFDQIKEALDEGDDSEA
ncbi:MAG: hypothetical protein JWN75_378 [Candidatus Saccharibacteria bacterium]|nr:hypothetical protein [Candidatus Saccharibacteria bacterium]